ncbi:MAG: cohesin domain-containing protein [Bacteroidota bacterium]
MNDVLIEDKFAPILACATDTISCADDPTSQINNRPTATDNCCSMSDSDIAFENLSQINGFVGPFAAANWTNDIDAGIGEAFDFLNDGSLLLTGANNTGGTLSCGNPSSASPRPIVNNTLASCYIAQVCIDIPADGIIGFDWSLAAGSGNLFSNSDPAAYAITSNLVTTYTQLSSSSIASGSVSGLAVSAGGQFCFVIGSNGSADNALATYSNLTFATNSSQCEAYCFYRRWTATDCNGNTGECYQKVQVTQRSISDVVFPADTILSCSLVNGVPGPSITGQPTIDGNNADGVCMINVFPVEDLIDTLCENSFKIIRTWRVMDWCTPGQPAEVRQQIIEVLDTIAPTFTSPNDTIISTDAQTCSATLVLPTVSNLTDNCSSTANINVVPSCTGCTITNILGNYVVSDLPVGTSTITYTATDNCGNSSTCTFNITTRDEICPNVQGSQALVATLQIDGSGRVSAATFDNGSYDNCSSTVFFKAIRMVDLNGSVNGSNADQSANACGDNNGDDAAGLLGTQIYFDDTVTFCCADIGSTADSVILRVFDVDPGTGPIAPERMDQGFLEDLSGNRIGNFCDVMVPVEVQDRQSPLLLSSLPDVTISCNFAYDANNLSASFGRVVSDVAQQSNITLNDPDNTVNTPQAFTWGQDALVRDNCNDNLSIQYDSTFNLNPTCNTGTITRQMTISSGAGTPAVITQTIAIMDFSPFSASDITWQGNLEVFLSESNCEVDLDTLGAPIYTNDNCSKAVSAPTNQLIFSRPLNTLGAGMCQKVLRNWVVTDWCQPGSEFTDPNLLNGQQTVIVRDTIFPSISFDRGDCDTIFIAMGESTANYTLNASIDDNCTAAFDASNVRFRISPGGSITSGNGTAIDADLPSGTHQIIFTAMDDCGLETTDTVKVVVLDDPCNSVTRDNAINFGSQPVTILLSDVYSGGVAGSSFDVAGIGSGSSLSFDCGDIDYVTQYPTVYPGTVDIPASVSNPAAVCSVFFTLQDLNPPTLTCNPPAEIPLGTGNQVVINVADLNPTATDNCTSNSDLIFSFRELNFTAPIDPLNPPSNLAVSDTTITCDDVSVDGTVQLTLWVYDQTGKGTPCDPFINIANTPDSDCPNAKSSQPAIISGQVLDEENGRVENVVVTLNGNRRGTSLTDVDGNFDFSNIPMGFNYSISPAKDDRPLNGVSTYDLVKISKHVLSLEELDSPYKMIAADANRNGEITALDMVEIRKLILFVNRDFQENTSWRFIDANYLFPNSDDPFTASFPEVYNINNLSDDMRIDFVAVKVGDVNCSAQPNQAVGSQTRNRSGELVFHLPDMALKAGQSYEIPFRLDPSTSLLGFQYTLEFDPEVVALADIDYGELPGMDAGNFGRNLLSEGALTMSWAALEATKAPAEGVAFSLRFRALRDGQLSEVISSSSRFTPAEGYGTAEELLDIALQFDQGKAETAGSRFLLFQNRPNPFKAETLIGFYLPQASQARLRLFDPAGKEVLLREGSFEAGYNEFRIERGALPQGGIFYYQLQSDEHTAVKKMTVLE